ncbi:MULTISPECIES: hypothetical protein [unclassified Streptomyces]|uniref:hypothetical protein n=1 Tax=unclassified Streptomyces TaxID=2593676 RepID=UPI003823BF5F
MPRRRPGGLRHERWRPRGYVAVRRVPHVSARTRAAVRRVEEQRLRPGLVAEALDRFAAAFSRSGRYLDASEVWQPGLEIEDARDDLDDVMRHLPEGARADLGRLVARIDAEFERRTLPDPGRVPVSTAGRWWWWRLRER